MKKFFKYKKNELYCEKVSLKNIAEKFGTPIYIYSKSAMLNAFWEFNINFSPLNKLVCYSVKANSNISVIKLFSDSGAGIDCNSAGELFRSLKAKVNPNKIIFTGVGKTEEEIYFALRKKVMMLKVESLQELKLINSIAEKLKCKAPIAIRINPNVDAKTHPYISTGLSENKFGIDISEGINAFKLAVSLKNLKIIGIDMHIGSQITSATVYVDAVKKLILFSEKLKNIGINLQHLDIGGGFGIDYSNAEQGNIKIFADKLLPILRKFPGKIIFEPGRFLTGNAGVLLTKVLYTKTNKKKEFVIVDASMSEFLRPTLYNALHEVFPVKVNYKKNKIVDVVGPVCESSDFIRKKYSMQKSSQGDLLSVMSSGAYGFVMSSNYNSRRKPAEVLVDGQKFKLIRKRESFDDIINGE